MTIFALMINDRHTDLEIRLFQSRENALAAAERLCDESAGDDDWRAITQENNPDIKASGQYVFFGQYSIEGDYVSVEEVQVEE